MLQERTPPGRRSFSLPGVRRISRKVMETNCCTIRVLKKPVEPRPASRSEAGAARVLCGRIETPLKSGGLARPGGSGRGYVKTATRPPTVFFSITCYQVNLSAGAGVASGLGDGLWIARRNIKLVERYRSARMRLAALCEEMLSLRLTYLIFLHSCAGERNSATSACRRA